MPIIIRALEPTDIDAIYRWENDPDVWTYSAAHQPFSRQALRQFIDECSLSDIYSSHQLRLMADDEEGRPVGCADLYDFDPYHRRAAIGIIVDSCERRKGIATAMLNAIEEFATRHLSLHQLYADIAATNQGCLRLFQHCGYQRCAEMRQWILEAGLWTDAYRYQKIISQ